MKVKLLYKDNVKELRQLIELYASVFELDDFVSPPATHLQSLLNNQQQFFIIAIDENKVVGGLTAYILPSVYKILAEVYLYDIAVLREYQRSGIGTLLMHKLFEKSKAIRASQVFVQTEHTDVHAVKFYQKLGGIAEVGITHFIFPL